MSSTDSAGSARGGGGGGSGPSCGLVSSLFPSSCRGRAEAFARRLHRRLTSLGGENGSPERDADADKQPRETSWLRPSSSGSRAVVSTNNGIVNHVLQRQPRHSPETDLFYDFDVELENGPGSPVEEATAAELAHLLMNPEILKANHHNACHCSPSGTKASGLHQDTEAVYVSPINGTPPDSDSSEMFFDPESSDTEKPKSEAYFDPITTTPTNTTSDSEVTSNLSNCSTKAKLALNGRRTDKSAGGRVCEDTSESESCSLRRNPAAPPCENGRPREELVCSSEDSLNGRSSQETTSPSHESLWSTFDDSTVSLQDESPPRIGQPDQVVPHNRLPKSHSDSELPNNGSNAASVTSNHLDRWHEEDEEPADEVDFVRVASEELLRNGKEDAKEDDHTENSFDTEEDEQESTETAGSKMPSKCPSQLKPDDTIASDTDTESSTYSSTINIPVALTFECTTGDRVERSSLRNEVGLQVGSVAQSNGSEDDSNGGDDDDKMRLLLTKLSGGSNAKQQEEEEEESSSLEQESQSEAVEEEEERPQRIRRCSSLKTGKTPPGTPGRKKIVRFADVLGLDLAAVRTFLDEIPRIPNSAYSDLVFQKDDFFQKDGSPLSNNASAGNGWGDCYLHGNSRRGSASRKMDRMLVPLFQQPGGMANFLDLVRERRVCLENVLVQNPVTLAIQGTVRVINLDFHKSVHIRYTLNSWRNFSDLQATYVPNSCDGFSDKFSFVLYCHTLTIGQRLEFAVRFQCKGAQYWDNNGGANYCFQCLPGSSPAGYIPITASENSRHVDWSPMFY